MNLVVYGAPGVGKTTVGAELARRLGREFVDGDACIEARWQRPVDSYFDAGEEALFRAREVVVYRELAARDQLVIAPGGGALLEPHTRAVLEGSSAIFCLMAPLETLIERLTGQPKRPLLGGDMAHRLEQLLRDRRALYESFAHKMDTQDRAVHEVAGEIEAAFAQVKHLRFELGACSALFGRGLLQCLPELLDATGLRPPYAIVSDANVARLYGQQVASALHAPLFEFPAGESSKTLETVQALYGACLGRGMERNGTLVALGGGVTGDVAGFVAATLFRGVAWANLPTSLLAMADASLGGKVGVDLPQGKNLVGAFHAPRLVAADTDTLDTLPDEEMRSGMAEVIKAAIIGDAELFRLLRDGRISLEAALPRAAAVKVGIVNADPIERGERACLNLGHTVGHGLEVASGFSMRHGEAIAVGMVAACMLAEAMGLAQPGLTGQVQAALNRHELPTRAPGLEPNSIRIAMGADKKKLAGRLRFVLPRRIGEVTSGHEVDEQLIAEVLKELTYDN
jgi:shikimate kinase / 3-dehydroquinate synthase